MSNKSKPSQSHQESAGPHAPVQQVRWSFWGGPLDGSSRCEPGRAIYSVIEIYTPDRRRYFSVSYAPHGVLPDAFVCQELQNALAQLKRAEASPSIGTK